MYPTIEFSGFEVKTFLLCICVGFTLSSVYVYETRTSLKLLHWWLFLFSFWFFGRLGQEIFYNFPLHVPVSFGIYGGSSILGSLLASTFLIPIFARLKSIDWRTLADSLVTPLLIIQMCGKFGCLMEGCCFGIPTSAPWCVSNQLQPEICRHPTQVYELVSLAMLFCVVWFLSKSPRQRGGVVSGTYLLIYGVERFGVEFVRGDTVAIGVFRLTIGQTISLIFIVVGLVILISRLHLQDGIKTKLHQG